MSQRLLQRAEQRERGDGQCGHGREQDGPEDPAAQSESAA